MLAPWCSDELRRTGQVYLPTCQWAKIGRVGEVSCDAVGAEGETLWGERDGNRREKHGERRGRSRSAPPSLHAGALHPPPVGLRQQGSPVTCTWVSLFCRVLKPVRPPQLGVLPGRCQPEGPLHVLPAYSWPTVLTQESRGHLETPMEIRRLQPSAPTSWSGTDPVLWRRELKVHHSLLELTCGASATSHPGTVSINLGPVSHTVDGL